MFESMGTSGTKHKLAAPGPAHAGKPCVVVSEPRAPGEESPLASQLDPELYDVVGCNEDEDVLDQVIQRHPSALVFALGARFQSDLALLFLLRRVAPAVPIILVAATASLETQKMIQDVRPTYYMVRPVDRIELDEAVAGAIAHHARRPAS
jgi:DNA-binding NarL/FixJ family response regulator